MTAKAVITGGSASRYNENYGINQTEAGGFDGTTQFQQSPHGRRSLHLWRCARDRHAGKYDAGYGHCANLFECV